MLTNRLLLVLSGLCGGAAQEKIPPTLRVDAREVRHVMRGGIGASWHAIRADLPGHRGSAWGANPPLDRERIWKQIDRHARWLGLDWIRVEFSQRMYEPARGQFDWDNEEMRTLYRILDWCQTNGADVFLQQMWSYVEWNTLPGGEPLRSHPKSMEDFAEGLTTLVEHLVVKKKYSCIKWVCINNEPGAPWSWWQDAAGRPMSITPGIKAVREALDARGLDVPLSGPDQVNPPPLDVEKVDFAPYVGAYDFHSYKGVTDSIAANIRAWTLWAHENGKAYFLSEFGDNTFGWIKADPGPNTWPAILSNANAILRGLAADVDGFNRWSLLNRGDLDGHWQLIRTWDREKLAFLEEATPEPLPYYGFGLIPRFVAKHSRILKHEFSEASEGLLAGALLSPGGNLTVIVLNRSESGTDLALNVTGLEATTDLHRYRVTEESVSQPGFELKTGATFKDPRTIRDALPARSITVYSTFALGPLDPGKITDGSE